MSEFLDFAVETALKAGKILVEEFVLPQSISYKGEVDLVTRADRRSEELIVTRLRERYSGHTIVAEEGGGSEAAGARYAWHVDPLDGTTNFAHGYPCFAVSIGLLEEGLPLIGVIFDPTRDELFTATRGEGAKLNGKPIHVSGVPRLAEGLVSTGFPASKRTKNPNIYYYWDFTLRSHGVRRDGAAAVDLCSAACGRFDGFWEFGLKSWDTAAGMLMVEEAGGRVTNLDGNPYRPGDPHILASNGLIHEEMVALAAQVASRGSTPG
jgi:myo-inositol-1(or 4)-monophosphatase